MEYSPLQITSWAINQASVNFRRLKSYEAFFFSDHYAMRLEINHKGKKLQKHKHVESKQYATKKSMGN